MSRKNRNGISDKDGMSNATGMRKTLDREPFLSDNLDWQEALDPQSAIARTAEPRASNELRVHSLRRQPFVPVDRRFLEIWRPALGVYGTGVYIALSYLVIKSTLYSRPIEEIIAAENRMTETQVHGELARLEYYKLIRKIPVCLEDSEGEPKIVNTYLLLDLEEAKPPAPADYEENFHFE